MWCIVNLPNGTQLAVTCDSKALGQECIEKVCKSLGMLCENEYFGLERWDPTQPETRTRHWLNLRNRLRTDANAGSGLNLMLALRVKFWVPVHQILQENVRDLFYMQAKVDLIEGRLNAKDWNNAAYLSALLCQADGIRFNKASLSAKCPVQIKLELKEKKEKEQQNLAAKKRRLSKQKSMDSIDLSNSEAGNTGASSDSEEETSPLNVYKSYIIKPSGCDVDDIPSEYLKQIAKEHEQLANTSMSQKSAKYCLLQQIQNLPGFGEELFSGVTCIEPSVRCDILVGPQGLVVCTGDDRMNIPFSAIATAKSYRRIFKLEYVDDHNTRKELEVKLPKHIIAADLYRSITERHAFYVCDKVRGVVTSQFTRDFKGTIASMFREHTELGKRYVFDIQRTCREVHDHARRILHERGLDVALVTNDAIDAKRDTNEHEISIERCVNSRLMDAMRCNICMDREMNTMFNPCRHVGACNTCAAKCEQCPYCRQKVTNVVRVYLPPELRANTPLETAPASSDRPTPNTMPTAIAD
ncbi:unnamed protein product [Hermetia illucens]|uniref:RING-type E3 ubiquitin transferase n=1 Tax=Hermetia illucens TaxID=343691 RepID=A0A7R8Z142_HERIL|nr:E3 ubiquitin-protein ligase MYLIP [Hermetia illucens]CAD7089416.1 unnamed protein product [Hermetia illucens]